MWPGAPRSARDLPPGLAVERDTRHGLALLVRGQACWMARGSLAGLALPSGLSCWAEEVDPVRTGLCGRAAGRSGPFLCTLPSGGRCPGRTDRKDTLTEPAGVSGLFSNRLVEG